MTSGQYLRGNGTNVIMSAIQAADVPTLNQNTTGTAANLSGTPALPNGTTATTQTAGDNSTKLATTAYVATAIVGTVHRLRRAGCNHGAEQCGELRHFRRVHRGIQCGELR